MGEMNKGKPVADRLKKAPGEFKKKTPRATRQASLQRQMIAVAREKEKERQKVETIAYLKSREEKWNQPQESFQLIQPPSP